jgi:hypothetical protein
MGSALAVTSTPSVSNMCPFALATTAGGKELNWVPITNLEISRANILHLSLPYSLHTNRIQALIATSSSHFY